MSTRVALASEGMTCDHCAVSVQRTLAGVAGVEHANVSYPEKRADVSVTGAAAEALVRAVEGAGSPASIVEPPASDAVPPPRARHAASGRRPDVMVLGAGSAGFAAAIRAADLGARVTMIEGGTLGGTCVNVGCVPSKTLIRAAEVQHRAASHAFDGIRTSVEPPDLGQVIAQKDALVNGLRQQKYWDVLSAYPTITLRQGRGVVSKDLSISVNGEVVTAGRIIVTTGASPSAAPIAGLEEAGYSTSTELMELDRLPEHLVVLGGGYVGLELGQTFARLGTRVTVLVRSRLLRHEDEEVSDALAGYLRDEGLDVRTGVSIHRVGRDGAAYVIETTTNGHLEILRADRLLVATGRRPNTRGFGLEDAGVLLGDHDEIRVNQFLQTSRPEIYAAGDVVGDPMYVYVAAYAGQLAAENALNGNGQRYDLTALPRVTFTDPQVASVGLTEREARARGVDAAVSKLPLSYVPRALAARETRGFIKLVADRATNRLVGAHILATEASEMIQEPTLAIKYGISIEDLARSFHPYLTLAEGIKLAAQTFTKDVKKLSCCAA
jgi:mercuric reductase